MKTFINLTPHDIVFNDGSILKIGGTPARVQASFTDFDELKISEQTFGEIQDLPEPKEDVIYVVSAIVLAAAKAEGRTDVVAPATGHPDCLRVTDRTSPKFGQILSVPGYVK